MSRHKHTPTLLCVQFETSAMFLSRGEVWTSEGGDLHLRRRVAGEEEEQGWGSRECWRSEFQQPWQSSAGAGSAAGHEEVVHWQVHVGSQDGDSRCCRLGLKSISWVFLCSGCLGLLSLFCFRGRFYSVGRGSCGSSGILNIRGNLKKKGAKGRCTVTH